MEAPPCEESKKLPAASVPAAPQQKAAMMSAAAAAKNFFLYVCIPSVFSADSDHRLSIENWQSTVNQEQDVLQKVYMCPRALCSHRGAAPSDDACHFFASAPQAESCCTDSCQILKAQPILRLVLDLQPFRVDAAATKRPASIEAGLLCRFQRRGYFFFLSALAACAAASASMGAQPPPKALKS